MNKVETTRVDMYGSLINRAPLVKVLTKDGKAPYTDYKWNLPDGDKRARKMRRVSGDLEMCENGYHFTTLDKHIHWSVNATDRVWYVEVDMPYYTTGSKSVAKGARIISEVPEELLDKNFVAIRRAFNKINDIIDEKMEGPRFPFYVDEDMPKNATKYNLFYQDNEEFIDTLINSYGRVDYVYSAVSNGFRAAAREIMPYNIAYANSALLFAATCIARRHMLAYQDYIRDNPERYPDEDMSERIIDELMKGVLPIGINKNTGKLLTTKGEID